MGRKLDSVKDKSREGSDSFKETDTISKKAVSDVKQMKELIDSLPADVDDEIIQAAETVKEGTKSDAEGYMNSEVSRPHLKRLRNKYKKMSELRRFSSKWTVWVALEGLQEIPDAEISNVQRRNSIMLLMRILRAYSRLNRLFAKI